MNQNNITIVVKDTNNNLLKDAQISIEPGNVNGKTNEKGQVILNLPDEKKVTVKVELNEMTQEVPYYITNRQNNRLEINLKYLQQIQIQESQKKSAKDDLRINSPQLISIIVVVGFAILVGFLVNKSKNKS